MIDAPHPGKWSDKLFGHITLLFIRRLTIIYFELNVFLKHFNSLCTVVDLCSILRFVQLKLLLILMFARMATETRKRAHFKYVMKSRLFSTSGSMTHSASICLMPHFRCRQLCHTPSICLIW